MKKETTTKGQSQQDLTQQSEQHEPMELEITVTFKKKDGSKITRTASSEVRAIEDMDFCTREGVLDTMQELETRTTDTALAAINQCVDAINLEAEVKKKKH